MSNRAKRLVMSAFIVSLGGVFNAQCMKKEKEKEKEEEVDNRQPERQSGRQNISLDKDMQDYLLDIGPVRERIPAKNFKLPTALEKFLYWNIPTVISFRGGTMEGLFETKLNRELTDLSNMDHDQMKSLSLLYGFTLRSMLRSSDGQGDKFDFARAWTRLIKSYNHNTVKVWDISTDDVLRSFTMQDEVENVFLSPDGLLAFIQCKSLLPGVWTVGVWDVATGCMLNSVQIDGKLVTYSFAQNGTTVIIASPSTVYVVDLSSGLLSKQLAVNHASETIRAHGVKDDEIIALVANYNEDSCTESLFIKNMETGKVLGNLPLNGQRDFSKNIGIRFSPDGSRLATTSRHLVMVWKVSTGKLLHTIRMPEANGWNPEVFHGALGPIFRSDGALTVCGLGHRGEVRILTWDLPAIEKIRKPNIDQAELLIGFDEAIKKGGRIQFRVEDGERFPMSHDLEGYAFRTLPESVKRVLKKYINTPRQSEVALERAELEDEVKQLEDKANELKEEQEAADAQLAFKLMQEEQAAQNNRSQERMTSRPSQTNSYEIPHDARISKQVFDNALAAVLASNNNSRGHTSGGSSTSSGVTTDLPHNRSRSTQCETDKALAQALAAAEAGDEQDQLLADEALARSLTEEEKDTHHRRH